ncbi:hypothetical protein [Pseudomonas migulae]|jgi:hypothetical protein|uniref:Uncharacterized protein n=1 Tax=Pseudomonas migulae TaxID=78543 RepID=A0A1H5L0E4_9PSED|nr:hypothetical protein [Pseudomonas migulae]SEE70562.1 hypothetical protein SAMN04490194_3623 [Pseudomonas migulae]
MSQTADCRNKALKWMREPSSGTRIVVIASGLDSDHIELIHQGFSCFENVALIHVETANVASAERSILEAVDQVKSLARASHSRHLEVFPDTCRSCP